MVCGSNPHDGALPIGWGRFWHTAAPRKAIPRGTCPPHAGPSGPALYLARSKTVSPLLLGLCRCPAAYVVVLPSFPTTPARKGGHFPFLVSEQFGIGMTRRSFKIDKWVWSEKDLAEMSWHDVIIHAIAATTELISRPNEEPRMEPRDLLLDIDYVLNWREALTERRSDFWICPATLIFRGVSELEANFTSGTWPLLVIYEIRRDGRRWTISLDEGPISFASPGFEQYLRREAVLKANYTYLSDRERGGVSFKPGRDQRTV